ncbi:hypothetical protein D9613_009250 [Agrocybe pediades]|uniref:EamA domain-containing protein n=1 Tax=Agrocybe pediades TaxID=84607 RepID=A0A8H4VTJ2_9AGAR|nr:hypothetical protein D9613_009250 [Agrocybe pediades]
MSTIPTSRNAYTAVSTPELEHFPRSHAPGPSSLKSTTLTLGRGEQDDDDDDDLDLDMDIDESSSSRRRAYNRRGWCLQTSRLKEWHRNVVDLSKRNTGLLLVAASQAFFSLMNVAVKKLNSIDPPVPTLELVWVRMNSSWSTKASAMLSTGVPDPFLGPKGVRVLLFVRGSIGFFGLFGVYYSLQYLSLSDATVLTFLAPMCTAIAGALLLGEKFTRKEALAGIVSLVGVVLIARPAALFGSHTVPEGGSAPPGVDAAEKGTPRDRLIAVGVALIGVLGATGAYTSIRAIGKRAHPLHSMTFFSSLCVLISTIGLIVNKTPIVVPTRWDWLALLLMIGLLGFVSQTLLTMGLQRETAGRGSMAVYTQIVFATILERIFFHAVPTALSVIGTLLILSSALYVVFTKEKEKEKASSSAINMTATGSSSKPKKSALKSHRKATVEEMEEGLLSSRPDDDDDSDDELGAHTASGSSSLSFEERKHEKDVDVTDLGEKADARDPRRVRFDDETS